MPEYLDTYLEFEDVKNRNPFIGRKPDTSELPDFEINKSRLPEPVWDGHDESVEAYYKAWEIAFFNIFKPTEENGFVSPYIDTAFNGDSFLWDSCFMLMFGKYGDSVFKFQGTLDNFYCKQQPDGFIGRQYHESNGESKFHRFDPVSTGPEIVAWCEWQYYQNYGDKDRLRDVYYPILCYHRWMRNYRRRQDGSYWATGWACGMDNLPRFDIDAVPGVEDWQVRSFHHSYMSWIDANFQALLSCKELLKMAEELDISDGVDELEKEAEFLTKFINEKMWSEEDKFYYDLRSNGAFLKVKCVAAYWGLLADGVPDERKADFIAHLENEKEFKRPHRVPSLSADHPEYEEGGGYWNGGVWPPTNYMIIRGLTEIGKEQLAYDIALNHYENMLEVYRKEGTFFENYAPETADPGNPAKSDFVGWSGIIPITVFIEYILGIQVHAEKDEIVWHVRNLERHGIKKLPIGRDMYADLICEARNSPDEKPEITLKADKPIKLTVIYGDNKFEM